VLDLHVALVALDLMDGDMRRMDQVGVAVLIQPRAFEMAFVAILTGHLAVTDDDLAVALIAAEAFLEDHFVVESRCLVRGQILPDMTEGTIFGLRKLIALLEMADEAGALGDGDVRALDDLRMAACAAQPFPPPQVGEMDLMIKDDVLEFDPALEEPFLMAARPQAALIGDLGPGLGLHVEFRPVAEDLVQAFQFHPQKGPEPRRIMAGAALNVGVGRFLPALVEGFHVVADRTEVGSRREFGYARKKKQN
jgi:hypothetical protein